MKGWRAVRVRGRGRGRGRLGPGRGGLGRDGIVAVGILMELQRGRMAYGKHDQSCERKAASASWAEKEEVIIITTMRCDTESAIDIASVVWQGLGGLGKGSAVVQ